MLRHPLRTTLRRLLRYLFSMFIATCEKVRYAQSMNFDYEFFAYDKAGGQLIPQSLDAFSYPMGDTTIRYTPERGMNGGAQVMWVRTPAPDWSLVYSWTNFLRDFDRRILVLPYLPSARGDKDTPSPARINATLAAQSGITDLVTLDPHSPVWLQTFHSVAGGRVRVHTLDLPSLVKDAVGKLSLDGIIAPDAGAAYRAGAVARAMNLPLLTATKHRDPATGRLSRYKSPADAEERGRYLVVDDICDGGGTFNLLAEALPSADLHLWVSHGGFTKGVQSLVNNYSTIYTTDSLRSAAQNSVGFGAVRVTPLLPAVTRVIGELS